MTKIDEEVASETSSQKHENEEHENDDIWRRGGKYNLFITLIDKKIIMIIKIVLI